MIYVMDATAMIAFLNGEPGADVIDNCLLDPASNSIAHACSVPLCEEAAGRTAKPFPEEPYGTT